MIQSPAGYQGDVRIKRYLDFYQAGYGVAMLSSGVAFSPLSLFANGEQGGWYDPSDLTTLFQDAAGTTPVTAVEQPVGRVLDKSGRGNHLSQSTSTARPVLSARVNLLTYTEEFENAAWQKYGTASVSAVNATSPIGTASADRLTWSGISDRSLYYSVSFVSGVSYRLSIWVKNNGGTSKFRLRMNGAGNTTYSNNYTATSEWAEYSLTATVTNGAGPISNVSIETDSDNTANLDILIWGADLRPSNAGVGLPAYQRVGAATSGSSSSAGTADYDTTGFPYYLKADGADDRLFGPGISNLISNSSYEVCIGARVLAVSTDTVPWLNQSLLADGGGYIGVGYMTSGNIIGAYNYDGITDTATRVLTPPSTFVLQQRHDNGELALSLNGGTEASTASGNTAVMTGETRVFSSNGSNSVQAHLYGLVIRSTAFTATERASIRDWMNSKTKAF